MVRVTGLEPAQLALLGPKPSASTNSATPAWQLLYTNVREKSTLLF